MTLTIIGMIQFLIYYFISMSQPYKLTHTDSIKLNSTKKFIVNDIPVLITNLDGEFFAINDLCTHEDSSLALGCLRGEYVDCTLHGSRFSVKTGIPIDEPATEPVETYPLTIKDDYLYIEI